MRRNILYTMGLVALLLTVGITNSADAADLCWKQSYGRGVGVIPTACPSNKPQYDAGLCYPYCAGGFNGVGPMCWGSGWDWFRSYGRGVGVIPTSCQSGMQYDAGLCYTACKPGMKGVGPVCWGNCGGSFPTECAAACATSPSACAEGVTSQVTSAIGILTNIVGAGGAIGKAGAAVTKATVKSTLTTLAKKAGKSLTESALESASTTVLEAQATGQFDWYSLDPTGIASVVDAYNKPICGN